MESDDGKNCNWTEAVEDLVDDGEIDKAISLIETVISKLQKGGPSSSSELTTALLDLSKLYSTKGLSLKADETRSLALQINQDSQGHGFSPTRGFDGAKESSSDGLSKLRENDASTWDQIPEDGSSDRRNDTISKEGCLDDDWEAIADCAADELLSPECLPGVSKLSLEDTQVKGPKRRGRGTFSYGKHGLYSDEQSDEPVIADAEDKADCHSQKEDAKRKDLDYGTRHVLVLSGFPPSKKTTDLEKVLEPFIDRGVSIRWVNDTVALAVFRSPAVALEACSSIRCPFTVRLLDENDELLSSIPERDLEPPRPRPKTSARTAQRLIAQSMGIKLPSPTFGSKELRKQEEARRNRIVSRQNMRDDAWGDDTN